MMFGLSPQGQVELPWTDNGQGQEEQHMQRQESNMNLGNQNSPLWLECRGVGAREEARKLWGVT